MSSWLAVGKMNKVDRKNTTAWLEGGLSGDFCKNNDIEIVNCNVSGERACATIDCSDLAHWSHT